MAKNKAICLFSCSYHEKAYPIFDFREKIEKTKLADIEKAYEAEQYWEQKTQAEKDKEEQIFARAEAENEKARTPFQNFICKLFGIE